MKTELKDNWFAWNGEDLLIGQGKIFFAVPKKYLFSLQRFITRIAQKNFGRKIKHG